MLMLHFLIIASLVYPLHSYHSHKMGKIVSGHFSTCHIADTEQTRFSRADEPQPRPKFAWITWVQTFAASEPAAGAAAFSSRDESLGELQRRQERQFQQQRVTFASIPKF